MGVDQGACGKEEGREMVGTRELCVSVAPSGAETWMRERRIFWKDEPELRGQKDLQ